MFAALAGVISLAVIGQLIARQLALDSAELPILRAFGMTRGSLLALSAARLALVTVAGAILAVAIAVAASPLMPIGAARLAEPEPGVGPTWPCSPSASRSSRRCRSRCSPGRPGAR